MIAKDDLGFGEDYVPWSEAEEEAEEGEVTMPKCDVCNCTPKVDGVTLVMETCDDCGGIVGILCHACYALVKATRANWEHMKNLADYVAGTTGPETHGHEREADGEAASED